mmetsp:Transcript_122033/g.352634  ORF Transcript_122033/g.352634 Transcript_122033/m.352634 type:complete len:206 (+) Transcript_122033:1168-1785(+)
MRPSCAPWPPPPPRPARFCRPPRRSCPPPLSRRALPGTAPASLGAGCSIAPAAAAATQGGPLCDAGLAAHAAPPRTCLFACSAPPCCALTGEVSRPAVSASPPWRQPASGLADQAPEPAAPTGCDAASRRRLHRCAPRAARRGSRPASSTPASPRSALSRCPATRPTCRGRQTLGPRAAARASAPVGPSGGGRHPPAASVRLARC